MKKNKIILFSLVSAVFLTTSYSAMAWTEPTPVANPQTISQAVSSAYQLGQLIGPNISLSHNNRWSTDDAVNGVDTIKYMAKETAAAINAKAKANGFPCGVSEKGLYNLLWRQFGDGMLNATHTNYK